MGRTEVRPSRVSALQSRNPPPLECGDDRGWSKNPCRRPGFGRRERARRAAAGGARRWGERRRGAAARSLPRATGPSGSGRSSADRPLERGPGLKGWVAYPLKRLLRPFLRWYVEPLAHEQRMFNDVVLKMVDGLLEEVDRGERSREEAARTLAELEERLTRTERRGGGAGARDGRLAAGRGCAPRLLRLRGEDARLDRRRPRAPATVRGRLPRRRPGARRRLRPRRAPRTAPRRRDRGARASTPTPTWSPTRRGEGLEVEQADALAYLEALPRREPGRDLRRPGRRAPAAGRALPASSSSPRSKLRPGGLLVAETINPLSPLALRSYFADLTHAQPLVPETLALLAKQAGFREVETRFLNAPRHADDVDERIREILFAPLDYAIVART